MIYEQYLCTFAQTYRNMKEYFIDKSYLASKGIASAVLACLGIGLLVQTIGQLSGIEWLISIGGVIKTFFIPALGVGIAIALRSSSLVVICAAASALIGGGCFSQTASGAFMFSSGEPVGAICAALAAIWFGKKVSGKTNFDILLTPFVSIMAGGIVGLLAVKFVSPALVFVSSLITDMVANYPLVSSIVIGVTFALLILSPASSAALAIALQLDATASGAALIGCSVQFTAFAVLSMKENKIGAFFAQLICTPKLQTPNIIKYPKTIIFPLILSALMSPLGVLLFNIEASKEVAGMGFCAFVGPLYVASNNGLASLLYYCLVALIIPAVLCFLLKPLIFKLGWIKKGELVVDID